MTVFDPVTDRQITRDQWQTSAQAKESEEGIMQPYEELSLLVESVEDDLARAGNVALTRQFAQELRERFTLYRDACADAGIVWAKRLTANGAEQQERR